MEGVADQVDVHDRRTISCAARCSADGSALLFLVTSSRVAVITEEAMDPIYITSPGASAVTLARAQSHPATGTRHA